MPDKWDRNRDSFSRAHSDLFSNSRYSAEFFNTSGGTYDSGTVTGSSRSSIGSTQVEFVPPSMDSTIDNDGTNFSWDTSIRLPEGDTPVASLKPLGEDFKEPTEVEISDEKESDDANVTYQLHGYSIEKGSGMVRCRLTEL